MSRRPFALGAAATTSLLAVAVASAAAPQPARVGVDDFMHVAFTLQGRALTVNLRDVDGAPNTLAASLPGTQLVFACRGRSPKDGRTRIASRKVTWPAAQVTVTQTLDRDVSRSPRWCLIEQTNGDDIAVAEKLRIPNPAGTSPTTPATTPTP